MSSASKVGEIFTAAGSAFSKLGELTMQLHPSAEPTPSSSGKWTDTEIEMLRTSVKRFGEDLNKISEIIKTRTISQIKAQLKRKAYDDAGIPQPPTDKGTPKKVIVTTTNKTVTTNADQPPAKKQKTSEVTLSALNAPESDVDIEGLGETSASKKLEFDSDVDSSLL
ncbi:chromatin complexes subunit BAP18-like isoform X2 [Liolophura sinensis]|uniref:chromatin complexes subunit BAP18-like isoform X2 n=1 Tax=Liolophura sinensis TaxID=3198878 RepID=UPI003158D227